MAPAAPSARFPSTAWTCVRAVQNPDHPQFVSAWNRLITSYWKPVFHYLRARGFAAEVAEDLTDDFFIRLREGKALLKQADPGRGEFRQYLRVVLKGFAFKQTLGAKCQTRFEQQQFVSVHALIRDEDRAWEPPATETPEEAYDKQWKIELKEAVRRNLRAYYEGLQKPEALRQFEIFAARHFEPERVTDQPTESELAKRFGVTRGEVHHALRTVKPRFERFFRQELRDQVGSETEVDDELKTLL